MRVECPGDLKFASKQPNFIYLSRNLLQSIQPSIDSIALSAKSEFHVTVCYAHKNY